MRAPKPFDAALAALTLVLGMAEVLFGTLRTEQPGWSAAVVTTAAVAMLWRPVRPLVCLAVLTTLAFLGQVPALALTQTAAVIISCLVALGTVGRHLPQRASGLAFAGTAAAFAAGSTVAGTPWEILVTFVGFGAAWTAGLLLRREDERARRLQDLATQLVEERDVRAGEAVRAERLRIARELHDAVAHTVSVMTLQAGGVRRQLDAQPSLSRERDVLRDVERLGREAVAELHRVVGVLRAEAEAAGEAATAVPLAPQPGLGDLEELVARVRAAGLPVELRVTGEVAPLTAGLDLAAYRVVQEALTNVLKHAPGADARVTVEHREGELRIGVEDDGGTGGRGDDVVGMGHGLAGIRERVALYGGQVEAGPQGDRGFAVRARFPRGPGPAPAPGDSGVRGEPVALP